MLSAAPTHRAHGWRASVPRTPVPLCVPVCVCVRAPINVFVNEWPIRLPVSRGPWLTWLPGCTEHKGRLRPPRPICRAKRSPSTLPETNRTFPFDALLPRSPTSRRHVTPRVLSSIYFVSVTSAARDKASREDAQPEVHSPSSHHPHHHHHHHHQKTSTALVVSAIGGQTKQGNAAAPRADYKGTSIVCSASSDSGSPLPSHYLKPESEDATGSGSTDTAGSTGSGNSVGSSANGSVANCRTEEQNDVSAPSNGGTTTVTTASTGGRCIAGVFAGHGELKSVLGTVVKFATGISPDTGDTVLTLVLALLVNPRHTTVFLLRATFVSCHVCSWTLFFFSIGIRYLDFFR